MEDSTPIGEAALRSPPEAYDPVAKTLHALMALAIFFMVGLGMFMVTLPPSMSAFKTYDLHKSVGLTLLVLAVLRLGWRLVRGAPEPLTEGAAPWELLLARLVHVLLYAMLFVIPVLGWVGASASGLPMTFFSLGPIPPIVAPSEPLQHLVLGLHQWANWLLLGLIFLHVAGALKRHFVLRDQTLIRMLPLSGLFSKRNGASR